MSTISERITVQKCLVCRKLTLENVLSCVVTKMIEISGLDRPFANKDGVCGNLIRLGKVTSTICCIVRVGSGGEEVNVGVENNVLRTVGPVRVPSLRTNKSVREHDRDECALLPDAGQRSVVIFVQISDRFVCLTKEIWCRKRFVDDRQGEGPRVGLEKDKVRGLVNELEC